MQEANTRREKLEGETVAAWRGVGWRVPPPRWRRRGWGALLEGAGPEPHPDNDIQKSNSEVSNNNGAGVNLHSWTGARRRLRGHVPVKSIP